MAEYVISNPIAAIQPLEYSDSQDRSHLPMGSPARFAVSGSPKTPLIPTGAVSSGASSARGRARIRYENTGEIALPPIRRRPRPLRDAVQCTEQLQSGIRSHLLSADECLYRKRNSEAIQHLEAGLLGCSQFPELQSMVWMLLGTAHVIVGHFREASVCHLHHLAFCRELGDFTGITKAECNLGIAYTKLGLLKLAGRCFLQFLENSRRLQDETSISSALSNLGLLSKTLGLHTYREKMRNKSQGSQAREALRNHLQRAVTYLEQHLDIVEEQGDLDKQARAYGNLGWCYQTMKQYPEAMFCHNKRLEISRTTGDRRTESCTLCNLGNCLRATGKLQEAIDHYTLNLELSLATGSRQGEVVSLLNLGTTCELLEQLDKAVEWHTLHLSAMVDSGDLHGQTRALSTLAGIYEETQQMTKAENYYRKLAGVFGRLGKREAQDMAALFVRQMKLGAEQERQRSVKQSQRTLKRYKASPRRRKTRTVSRSNTYRLPMPMRRSTANQNKMGTWGPTRLPWYVTPPTSTCPLEPAAVAGLAEEEVEGEVLGNPGAEERQRPPRDHNSLAAPPTQSWQHSTQRVPTDQELLVAGAHQPQPQRTPFYKLSRIITNDDRPLPESPPLSDTGSATSFESVQEFHGRGFHRNIAGSRRHVTELQRVGVALSRPVSELGLEGMDKEWEQWLHIQETTDNTIHSQVGSLNIDLSVFFSRDRDSSSSLLAEAQPHHVSAPHSLDLAEQVEAAGEAYIQ